jgi:hypothetical protein
MAMPRHGLTIAGLSRFRTGFSHVCEIVFLLLLVIIASAHGTVLEFLESSVACSDVKRFVEADARIWSAFLSAQPGFIRKQVMLDPRDTAARPTSGDNPVLPSAASNCTVSISILWESRALWKSISPQLLSATTARFIADFGYEPALNPQPSPSGYDVVADFPAAADATSSPCSPVSTGVIVGAAVGAVALLAAAVRVHTLLCLSVAAGCRANARAYISHYLQVAAYYAYAHFQSFRAKSASALSCTCTAAGKSLSRIPFPPCSGHAMPLSLPTLVLFSDARA